MTRIVILGGPKTGKTTLSMSIGQESATAPVRHTDDLIEQCKHLGKDAWSEASRIASTWLDEPGPWIIEGVAMARALRKWRDAHPGERPPVDRVIRLTVPHVDLSKGQAAMAKGEQTVWEEIGPWLFHHFEQIIWTESAHWWSSDQPGGPRCIRCGGWMAHVMRQPCPDSADNGSSEPAREGTPPSTSTRS